MSNIKDLRFDDKNFNKHTEYGMSLLEKSLRENGAGRSILIDKDNNIIAGNGIVEAAGSVGLEKVKIVETSGDEIIAVKRTDIALDSEQGRTMALADNATASIDLDWNDELINEEADKWGFDASDWLGNDWKDEPEEVVEDESPEVNESEPAKSELGKIYQLGEHRLMCGDSTDAGNVAILMDGQKVDMVFTDPPYNMDYSGAGFTNDTNNNVKSRIKNIIDFDPMGISYLANMEVGSVYIFTSKDLIGSYLDIFKDWHFNLLIWEKTNTPPMVNNNFFADIEYLLYFHRGKRIWNNGLTPIDIYKKFYISPMGQGKMDAGADLHPTMKPIKFIMDKVKISSNKNGIVIDLFGGSGSTLIACEQLGRKCYMMELDPKYCDVIRKRYWKFTHDGNEDGWQKGTPAIC